MRPLIVRSFLLSNLTSIPILRAWLVAGDVAFSLLTSASAADTLINVNVGPGIKVGQAAAGSTTNDYWNSFYPANATSDTLFDLWLAASGTMNATSTGAWNTNVWTEGAL